MPSALAVEPIDVLQHCSFCLSAGHPFLTPDQLGFQRFEEGLETAWPGRRLRLESHAASDVSDRHLNSIESPDPYGGASTPSTKAQVTGFGAI
jgi:hypothetical protein